MTVSPSEGWIYRVARGANVNEAIASKSASSAAASGPGEWMLGYGCGEARVGVRVGGNLGVGVGVQFMDLCCPAAKLFLNRNDSGSKLFIGSQEALLKPCPRIAGLIELDQVICIKNQHRCPCPAGFGGTAVPTPPSP